MIKLIELLMQIRNFAELLELNFNQFNPIDVR